MRKISAVTDDEVGGLAYETYCKAVGGKAFNGDPLPSWAVMCKDEKKQNMVTAWKRAGRAVAALMERTLLPTVPPPVAKVDPAPAAQAAKTSKTSMPAPRLTLASRTRCCGSLTLSLHTGHYACPCGDHVEPL